MFSGSKCAPGVVAIWADGQATGADKAVRNILAGLAGGCTGATIMALGVCLLPAGPRDIVAWLPMLVTGTIAGALLALDNALDLDLTSFLYPVWQAGVAVTLATALRRTGVPDGSSRDPLGQAPFTSP